MVSNIHYIELYIQGQLVELDSQKSLNLRIQNQLWTPEKVSTTQAEWSYSFSIPSTPNNDKILGYANVPSKKNKFHQRYDAEVYADGELLFKGSLTIGKYKDNHYECNLVNVKINTLEDIFGEDVLTDMEWYVPFDGAPTINEVNNDMSTKYFFPFVSYGVFQKVPSTIEGGIEDYTPKHDMDKYNKWWVETFYPSMNVVEMMRKCYENKGYDVGGNVFNDVNLSNIYASCNLADDQAPIYNLGNQRFGDLWLSVKWDNYISVGGRLNYLGSYLQDLNFPIEKVAAAINSEGYSANNIEYNYSTVTIWNMLNGINNPNHNLTIHYPTYMYDPGEKLIVIPSDGWYKIDLQASATLSGNGTTFTAPQWTNTFRQGDEFKQRDVTINRNWDQCPLEIQLIRNYDENLELIKGSRNVRYYTGDPNETTYTYRGSGYTGGTYQNKVEWVTDAPHQYHYGAENPTNNSLTRRKKESTPTLSDGSGGGTSSGGGSTGGGTWGGGRRDSSSSSGVVTRAGANDDMWGGSRNPSSYYSNGYSTSLDDHNAVQPYDQSVSEAFICGFTTMWNGRASVMRNGYSWASASGRKNEVFANVKGLEYREEYNGTVATVETDYCKNTYANARGYCYASNGTMNNAVIQCCVWLNKNDVLELVAVQRDYDGQKYATKVEADLRITAISTRSETRLRNDPYWNFYSTTEFPKDLNLFNFTNKETKVSDWIKNVQTAFNLEITQNGNSIDINTQQGINKDITYAVNIDDRVNSNTIETERIDYPRDMSVKYKIDKEEWGFELTVPQDHINDDDWYEWGDEGWQVVQLNDDAYETSSQNIQTNFSYTYYDTFNYRYVDKDGNESSDVKGIRIPVIEKSEYMAEGYGFEEAMAHDGYSLTQRFWYRQEPSQDSVWLASWMEEQVYLSYPTNSFNSFNLSYKLSEKSILSEYFNIHPILSSNYVNVEVYLTPKEYKEIKSGAMVKLNSDLHYISEISGYDPSGSNPTTLKLVVK